MQISHTSTAHFFLKMAVFASPLILAVHWLDDGLRKAPSIYQHKRVSLERERDKVNLMIVGSSEALYGIDPRLLSVPAFNFAFPGQGLAETDALSSVYLDKVPNLHGLLLSIAYCLPETKLSENIESWREYYYHQEFGINSFASTTAWLDLRTFFPLFLTRPRYGIRTLMGLDKPFRKEDKDGYLGFEIAPPAPAMTEKQFRWQPGFAEYHNEIMKPEFFSQNRAHLERVLSRAQKRGIPVFLVRTPAAPSYRRAVSPETGERYLAAVRNLLDRFSNVRAFDYYSDPRFLISDYRDNFHLGAEGARKFSSILENDIVRPYFSKHDTLTLETRIISGGSP